MYLLVVLQDKWVTALGCAMYTKVYSNSLVSSDDFEVNKTETIIHLMNWRKYKKFNSHCLFSYQIFTSLSSSPQVANNVPSGLKAKCCTGIAVVAFQTQCHDCSGSKIKWNYITLLSLEINSRNISNLR